MIIIVTGSVCAGKTRLSKKLSKKLHYNYLDVNKLIENYHLKERYDSSMKSYPIDIKKLNKVLIKHIKKNKNMIIDSHLSHYIPKKYVDLCIVTTCGILTLKKRLKKRGYSNKKIKGNLDVEIFNVCLIEAKKIRHNILVVDTTKGYNIKNIANFIKKCKI